MFRHGGDGHSCAGCGADHWVAELYVLGDRTALCLPCTSEVLEVKEEHRLRKLDQLRGRRKAKRIGAGMGLDD